MAIKEKCLVCCGSFFFTFCPSHSLKVYSIMSVLKGLRSNGIPMTIRTLAELSMLVLFILFYLWNVSL